MSVTDLDEATESLAHREGLTGSNRKRNIGFWSEARQSSGEHAPQISAWAKAVGLDAVVWTALGPKFGNEERVPTIDEALAHLQALPTERRRVAEEYIRRAPLQIDTDYRRRLARELGWTPIALSKPCQEAI